MATEPVAARLEAIAKDARHTSSLCSMEEVVRLVIVSHLHVQGIHIIALIFEEACIVAGIGPDL